MQVLCGHTLSPLVGVYPGVDLMSHLVTLQLTVWGPTKTVLHSGCTIF